MSSTNGVIVLPQHDQSESKSGTREIPDPTADRRFPDFPGHPTRPPGREKPVRVVLYRYRGWLECHLAGNLWPLLVVLSIGRPLRMHPGETGQPPWSRTCVGRLRTLHVPQGSSFHGHRIAFTGARPRRSGRGDTGSRHSCAPSPSAVGRGTGRHRADARSRAHRGRTSRTRRVGHSHRGDGRDARRCGQLVARDPHDAVHGGERRGRHLGRTGRVGDPPGMEPAQRRRLQPEQRGARPAP